MRLTANKVVTWTDASSAGVTPEKVYLGPDPFGLGGFQVAVATSAIAPARQVLRDLFTSRKGKTQIQLVVAVVHDGAVHLFGPDPQAQAIELPLEQAERQLQSVLAEPDVLAATERFAGFRKAKDSTGVAGFTNSGLFASHHITSNVPKRPDWGTLGNQAAPLLNTRGKLLIEALGFGTQPGPNGTLLLSASGRPPRAVAVLLDESEQFDAKTQRFQLSPVAFGLAVASRHDVPWLIVLRKDQIRLYPGRDGVGVGSKGQAETFFEVDLSTIDSEYGALLPLIFSAGALEADGTADELLQDSSRYATELGARLRERIYDEIVPPVAVEVAQRLAKHAAIPLDADGLSLSYRVTLRILFRLLFQAYAEDRGLLPSGRNEGFDANSLKTNARRLIDSNDFGNASTIWFDLVQVWNAIDQGNPQWQIPSYNGGLFSADPDRSPEGALIKKIELPDTVLGPALKSLLIDVSDDGVLGPVDFRSLSVREFGTIYEGLLESSLSVSEVDLTIDDNGAWAPTGEGDDVRVHSGSVYFHTASGERKATGSYFTPKVIVDHLIERSIVPALSAHLEKIASYLSVGDASAAAREFFDFRVADLAMGSGHFLVAAVDKIEALMRTFLTEHSVPGVTEELLRLAAVARDALGTDEVAKSESGVDQIGLLRRQVARRCIYGIDTNPMAVELACLALWIHTFVPGLPMSNLDHGLVNANSLTGIGTIDEALDALQPGRVPGELTLFDEILTDQLASAKTLLIDVANASEASKSEVEEGARLLSQAREAADTARRIFDAAVALRAGTIPLPVIVDHVSLVHLLDRPEVADASRDFQPAHMPYLFPEVFLRGDPGFDVLIGNPPWEKVRHEPQQFWVVRDPGLHRLSAAARVERIEELRKLRPVDRAEELQAIAVSDRLTCYFSRAFKLQRSQHYDFAKLFAERNLCFVRASGTAGIVMPQALLVLGGWKPIRQEMVTAHHLAVAPLRNTGGWAFENVDGRTAMCVLSLTPGSGVSVSAAANSAVEFIQYGHEPQLELSLDELRGLSDELNVPWFENSMDPQVFASMAEFPRLGSGSGWIRGKADSTRWDFSSSGRNASNVSPVYSNSWRVTMTRHVAAFLMSPTKEGKWVKNLSNLVRPTSGLVRIGDRTVVGKNHPAIIYRFPSRNDDSRTLRAAALPAEGWLFSKGYAHGVLLPEPAPTRDVLALLGYLNSIPADWWARRFVDRHLGKRIIEGLPLPDWSEAVRMRVASLVAGILLTNGVSEIAGPRALDGWAAADAPSDPVVEINARAFLGLGLNPDEAESVFADFAASEAAVSYSRRTEIVQHMFSLGIEA